MRAVVIGLGVQGYKRRQCAGDDFVASIDPHNIEADFSSIEQVDLDSYDAALVCSPDGPKYELLHYLLSNKKHVLVEKPLFVKDAEQIQNLERLALTNQVFCYTAYNHRFEPHFVRMKKLIDSKVLGDIYHCRLFYGNGTAALVKKSPWRDRGAGVLPDLGSHLLDTVDYWFGSSMLNYEVEHVSCSENKSPDHVIINNLLAPTTIQCEMTLLSWRNHFTCDIFAEHGTAHIESLCKWGPSTFTHRKRVYPSGRPPEESTCLVQADPTWQLEYSYFKKACLQGQKTDLLTDKSIHVALKRLSENALLKLNTANKKV